MTKHEDFFFVLFNIVSVQFSHSVVSNSLPPHESQHARPPCPSPTPGVYSNSCPSSLWCHLAILSSVVPFSFCPQSLPASGSFPMSQLFTWGGQVYPTAKKKKKRTRHSNYSINIFKLINQSMEKALHLEFEDLGLNSDWLLSLYLWSNDLSSLASASSFENWA